MPDPPEHPAGQCEHNSRVIPAANASAPPGRGSTGAGRRSPAAATGDGAADAVAKDQRSP